MAVGRNLKSIYNNIFIISIICPRVLITRNVKSVYNNIYIISIICQNSAYYKKCSVY